MSYASPRPDPDPSGYTGSDSQSDSSLSGSSSGQRRSETAAEAATRRLTWLLIALSIMLLLRFVVPYFAEQISYAMSRGKLRAEMESAAEGLETLKLDELSKAYQLVSQRLAPSVVNINVESGIGPGAQDEISSLFGSQPNVPQGQGSGVIVDPDGYILTNNHVVRNATRIEVSLADGRVFPGRAVGVDPLTDLALLKIDATKLAAAEWGDSNELQVGALVWAMGSPFGLQQSITAGILSGKNRVGKTASVYYDFLQTDAAVNPGNSGGPLVDARGRVIGINTAILGDAYQGISFAIPSNEAQSVYERLRQKGRVERGWLGVRLIDVDPNLAKQLGYPGETGAIVDGVTRHSPAETAQLRAGDIITRWDGQEVRDATILRRLVARSKIGEPTEATIWRRGQEMTVRIIVGERPANLDG